LNLACRKYRDNVRLGVNGQQPQGVRNDNIRRDAERKYGQQYCFEDILQNNDSWVLPNAMPQIDNPQHCANSTCLQTSML
jgi:hypothetical protein